MGPTTPLTAEQGRVIAALIEKAATTPDHYPLSTNALVAACNQSTSRDPVVDYTDREVDAVMLELRERGLARTVHGSGHRVGKHKHVVDEAVGLGGAELAVLAVLVLRGPQTRNEITSRTRRYADGPAGDAAVVDAAIDRLTARPDPLVVRLDRRPGEREPRVAQRWVAGGLDDPATTGAADPAGGVEPGAPAPSPPDPPTGRDPGAARPAGPAPGDALAALEIRVARLESELAAQARRIDRLLDELGG